MSDRIDKRVFNEAREVHVHEHRAPTDDSIRLAHEMEEKARAAVLDRFTLNNELRGTVVVRRRPDLMNDEIVCVFDLNGRKHRAVVERDADALFGKDEAVRMLVRRLADAIAVELLVQSEVK